MKRSDQPAEAPHQHGAFATTRWSMVISAGRNSSPDSKRALEQLCETYWYPLYAYSRRRGLSVEDAQDRTQEFFARLLEQEFLQTADRERGRFRSFLLTVFKRFLSKERDRSMAQKRGGGRTTFSIDVETGENRYRYEPIDNWTAEKLFERRWALTLLERVLDELEQEYAGKGKSGQFERCRTYLTGPHDGPKYAEVADELQLSESAVRVAVHRMRSRYRELLKREVGQTLEDPAESEAELEYLRAAIRGDKT